MKKKDSNCVGILSDQGEAATASNSSEYTILTQFEHRLIVLLFTLLTIHDIRSKPQPPATVTQMNHS